MSKCEKKYTNKGMTLVELIIVVAIMAILAATISLAVIHYIENARQAKDVYHAVSLRMRLMYIHSQVISREDR